MKIWSGDTIDGIRVVFCDREESGIFASRENGRIVARSLGGTWLGCTYDSDPALVAAWLDVVSSHALGSTQ